MIDHDKINAQVDAITNSGVLGAEDVALARLLRYLIREELEGRGERIKAYSIAIDVFDRSEDFDSNTNSYVRVNMRRLRVALDMYYSSSSTANDDIKIEFPLYSYRPKFEIRENIIDNSKIENTDYVNKINETTDTKIKISKSIFIYILASIFICIFSGYIMWKSRGASIETIASLSPTLQISSDPGDVNRDQIKMIVEEIYNSDYYRFPFILIESGKSDYSINVSTIDHPDKSSIIISLYDSNLNLISSRIIPAALSDEGLSAEAISGEINDYLLAYDGALSRDYAKVHARLNDGGGPYNCAIQASPLLYEDREYNSDSKKLLDCLNKYRISNEYDNAFIQLLKGYLSFDLFINAQGKDRPALLADAQKYAASAGAYLDDSDALWILEILIEWHAQGKNREDLQKVLQLAQEHNMSPRLRLMVANSYSYYLGKGEYASEITGPVNGAALPPISLESSLFHLLEVPEHFLAGRYAEARSALIATRAKSSRTYDIFMLTLNCIEGLKNEDGDSLTSLYNSKEEIIMEIKNMNYNYVLEKSLIDAISENNCKLS